MKKLSLCIFLLLIALMPHLSVASIPAVRTGISNLHVNDIAQDSQGLIWIATAKGLCRYDGRNYTTFLHDKSDPKSIASDIVNGLFFDGASLWTANSGGVSRFDLDTWQFTNFNVAGMKSLFFLGLFKVDNRLYTYGLNGIYLINESECRLEQAVPLDGQVVRSVVTGTSGHIWIVCDESEALCFDSDFNLQHRIDFPPAQALNCIFIDPISHNVMFGTSQGTFRFDPNSNALSNADVSPLLARTKIRYLKCLDDRKAILVDDRNFTEIFDFNTDTFVTSAIDRTGELSNRFTDMTCAFLDVDTNLWIGTFNAGIKYLTRRERLFGSNRRLSQALHNCFVTRICNDSHGNIWIGTRYNGFARYSKSSGYIEWFNASNSPVMSTVGNFVQSLMTDAAGRLWICVGNALAVFDISNPSGKPSLIHKFDNVGNIVSLTTDSSGRIWAGSSTEGIFIYNPNLTLFNKIKPTSGKMANITSIIPLSHKKMLVSVFGDNLYTIDTRTLRSHTFDTRFSRLFANVINLKKSSSSPDEILIGSYGDGFMIYSSVNRSLRHIDRKEGLLCNDVLGIQEDYKGNYWLSSSYGIYRIDRKSLKITSYLSADDTGGDQFHEKSECTIDGNIFFGGNHGITEISPAHTSSAVHPTPVLLTDLRVMNRSISIDTLAGDNAILSKHISRTSEITLSHSQNMLSLDFIGICYDTPKNLEYAYRLDGIDLDWNFSGDITRASYSNLNSGTYQFLVKVRNGSGEWEPEIRLLTINVLPSPWMHPLAILIYIAIATGCLLVLNKIMLRRKLRKERALLAQNEMRREKDLAQMKVNFFTNISHELRTPLTLIYNPVKLLMNDKSIVNPESVSLISLINRNTERLLRLVNQILDYGKIKNDTLELKVSRHDCIAQISDIVSIFKFYAAEKNIEITLNSDFSTLTILYDYDKIDKIINNLLINSIKYAPIGGKVTIDVALAKDSNGGNRLHITVSDNGNGVDSAALPSIFDRFKRFVGKQKSQPSGYGIGLNYVKHLVENHKGSIAASNLKSGGMSFNISIPIDENRYTPDEFADVTDIASPETHSETETEITLPETSSKHKILVVEDNPDMAELLSDLLAAYEVKTASDGIDAMEKLKIEEPDLIISDVMMPRMDGFELCRTIRTDKELCHIPIILLTAKTLDDDQIKGFKLGADLYISKPFNHDLLIAMVERLLSRTEHRHDVIARIAGTDNANTENELHDINSDLSPLDQRFLERLNTYISENISDSELNVSLLGRELGFSRTNFYRKVKSLTGMMPNDFLRLYRLNHAAELLKRREYQIGEIGEMSGFGTQSHFSSCFKKHFGVSPKDYIAQNK